MQNIKTPKKLIEVALPLDEINEASGKEKSVRHGHPSTLHLWWARRPLAAARAIIFAQMVNDPGYQRELGIGVNKELAEEKRERLFQIIRDLVKWENSTNEEVLGRARAEIIESWRETCRLNSGKEGFDPEILPPFHDPFAGGGSLPLEAKRLGLEAHATDLNPIPILLNRCLLQAVGRFQLHKPVSNDSETIFTNENSILIDDVRFYAKQILVNMTGNLAENYPPVKLPTELGGSEAQVLTWLWCRTVASPDPAAQGKHTPLLKSPLIANKKGRYIWIDTSLDSDGDLKIDIKRSSSKPAVKGTIGRSGGTCVYTGSPIPLNYIRNEGKNRRIGHRLLAVVVQVGKEKVYLSGDNIEVPEVLVPQGIPDNEILHWSGCTNVCVYGMTQFRDLYTPRQLVAMHGFAKEIDRIHGDILQAANLRGIADDSRSFVDGGTGARAYADAICMFLSCCLGRAADYWNSVTSWESSGEFVAHAFTKHALPMIWDFGEVNPINDGGGSWKSALDWVLRVIDRLPTGVGVVSQHNAMDRYNISNAVVSTDPPYYDNVPYSNLSDFFYMWTRLALRNHIPENFATIQTPKHDELVASHSLYSDLEEAMEFFSSGMTKTLTALKEEANPTIPVTIYYAFKQSETDEGGTSSSGWESFLQSVLDAGFEITGTWPIRTERSSRGRAIGANALASSIVLVCRQRKVSADSISRRDFQRLLRSELPEALADMIGGTSGASPISPVDLAQSSIGPGMAIFSRYSAILNQDGNSMSVSEALKLINKAITEFLDPDNGSFDPDTIFCDNWFSVNGWSAGAFGEADILAKAKGTSVEGVRSAGVIESGGGKVRLLKWSEYQSDWDPRTDDRTPVWEACHQLIRALHKNGENAAGTLLARMPEQGESIRQLAYHLYTLCERKKWAEDASAYNELISSWHAIVAASHEAGHKDEQIGLEF